MWAGGAGAGPGGWAVVTFGAAHLLNRNPCLLVLTALVLFLQCTYQSFP